MFFNWHLYHCFIQEHIQLSKVSHVCYSYNMVCCNWKTYCLVSQSCNNPFLELCVRLFLSPNIHHCCCCCRCHWYDSSDLYDQAWPLVLSVLSDLFKDFHRFLFVLVVLYILLTGHMLIILNLSTRTFSNIPLPVVFEQFHCIYVGLFSLRNRLPVIFNLKHNLMFVWHRVLSLHQVLTIENNLTSLYNHCCRIWFEPPHICIISFHIFSSHSNRWGPDQNLLYLYPSFHLSKLQSCKSIISTDFLFIFIFK